MSPSPAPRRARVSPLHGEAGERARPASRAGDAGQKAIPRPRRPAAPDYDDAGNLPGAVGFARDVTARKRAEEALRESEEKYRAMVETTSEWIWAVDRQGRLTYSNPAIEAILGYRPEEVLGRESFEYLHEDDRRQLAALWPGLIAEQRGWGGLVLRWRHKDDSYRYLESNAAPILDAGGQLVGYRGADRDITARKQVEEALRASEARHRAVVDSAFDAIITATPDGAIHSFNRGAERIFGYPARDVVGQPLALLMPERLRAAHTAGMRRHLATGEDRLSGRVLELVGRRRDGGEFPLELSITRIAGRDGTLFTGILRDITERKAAERRQADERFRALVQNASDVIMVLDVDGAIRYQSPSVARVLGFTPEELLGTDAVALLHPDDQPRARHLFAVSASHPGVTPPIEVRARHRDGSWRDIEAICHNLLDDPNVRGLVTNFRDITERKQTQGELTRLLASERAARGQAEAVQRRLSCLAQASRTFAEAPLDVLAVLETIAWQLAALIGDGCAVRLLPDRGQWPAPGASFHPDPGAGARLYALFVDAPRGTGEGLTRRVLQAGQPVLVPVLRPDSLREAGAPEYWPALADLGIHSLLVAPLRVRGQAIGTLALVRDRTAGAYGADDQDVVRDLAERAAQTLDHARLYQAAQAEIAWRRSAVTALRQSEERFRSIVETTNEWIWESDRDGRLTYSNPAVGAILGYDPVELLGQDPSRYLHDEDRPTRAALLRRLVAERRGWAGLELRWRHKEGGYRYLESNGAPIRDARGAVIGFRGADRDITARKRAEQQLAEQKRELERRAKALEATTREQETFIYTVSHDLKAPLLSLQGMAGILQEDYAAALDDDARLCLDRIAANASAMQTLLDELLDLSRVGRVEVEKELVDLAEVVGAVTEHLRHTLTARGAALRVAGPLPAVYANRTRLAQVLTNLVDNAVKYTPPERAPLVELAAVEHADCWELSVRDNGVGIPPTFHQKVLGLFQRLPQGKALNPGGSGAGLAIVARVVETHGGRLWLESEEGAGTTVHLTLPKPEPVAAGQGRAGHQPALLGKESDA